MSEDRYDVLVVGAGFSGMYLLHLLRAAGFRTLVVEAGSDVGGTWYWNRYPGARCDIESVQYSYQFDKALEQEWDWSERYAPQPEILRYANHVADRLDLRRDIRFDTRIARADFDEATALWSLEAEDGSRFSARFFVMATGCLSAPNQPTIAGIDSFAGPTYHTGLWPHQPVSFEGLRVGVIGTGSSAVQSIPQIAREAAQLTVFQRTPNYAVPAHNRVLPDAYRAEVKADYAGLRQRQRASFNNFDVRLPDAKASETTAAERDAEYQRRWDEGGLGFMAAFTDLMVDRAANDTAAEFVRARIREIVTDPQTAETLCPANEIGCKRLCVEIDYFETYNRPNVRLVDVSSEPIERITPTGIRAHGEDFTIDALVLATGFDAMTGALTRVDIRNAEGMRLGEKWQDGPRSFLGLAIAGFPNLFTVTGPGSPSVLTNMLPTIEQHCEWITACISHLRDAGLKRIEATLDAENDWVAHNADVAGKHLRSSCQSWYVGANVEGKARVFMPYVGGFPAYAERCDAVAAEGYAGFRLN